MYTNIHAHSSKRRVPPRRVKPSSPATPRCSFQPFSNALQIKRLPVFADVSLSAETWLLPLFHGHYNTWSDFSCENATTSPIWCLRSILYGSQTGNIFQLFLQPLRPSPFSFGTFFLAVFPHRLVPFFLIISFIPLSPSLSVYLSTTTSTSHSLPYHFSSLLSWFHSMTHSTKPDHSFVLFSLLQTMWYFLIPELYSLNSFNLASIRLFLVLFVNPALLAIFRRFIFLSRTCYAYDVKFNVWVKYENTIDSDLIRININSFSFIPGNSSRKWMVNLPTLMA